MRSLFLPYSTAPNPASMANPLSSAAQIRRRRESIERRLALALRLAHSDLTVEDYKRAIFNGPDASNIQAYMLEALDILGYDIDSATDEIVSLIQDAWNYFPHHSLNGKCPAELFLPLEA